MAIPGGLGAAGGLATLLMLMTAKEIFWTSDAVQADRQIPVPKMSQFATPTIKFLFCYS